MHKRRIAGILIFGLGLGVPLALSAGGSHREHASLAEYCEGFSTSVTGSTSIQRHHHDGSSGSVFVSGGPVLGETLELIPLERKVTFKLPGELSFHRLRRTRLVPVKTLVNTRHGRVAIVAATDFPRAGGETTGGSTTTTKRRHTVTTTTPCDASASVTSGGSLFGLSLPFATAQAQAATFLSTPTRRGEFYDGLFQVLQERFRDAPTVTRLFGALRGCDGGKKADDSAGRLLWGDARGRHVTVGHRSSATVRGTKWLVHDRCDGSTLTRVDHGVVAVRDFSNGATTDVAAGQQHIASP